MARLHIGTRRWLGGQSPASQGRLKSVASVHTQINPFTSFPSIFGCFPTPNGLAVVGNEVLCVSLGQRELLLSCSRP